MPTHSTGVSKQNFTVKMAVPAKAGAALLSFHDLIIFNISPGEVTPMDTLPQGDGPTAPPYCGHSGRSPRKLFHRLSVALPAIGQDNGIRLQPLFLSGLRFQPGSSWIT